MRILAVGGGSGGHVTPVVAVVREIRAKQPSSEIRFWCDKKFFRQASDIFGNYDESIKIDKIFAGKLRRYHHLSVIRQLLWPQLVFANIKDSFLVLLGFIQSFFKLLIWRPDVVFAKGGYVCLPVGLAARLLKIPLVIHDSDAHPGLTNRVLSRFSECIATGAPLEYYDYPKSKSAYTGIPISSEFRKYSQSEKMSTKIRWGVNENKPLVVITGGGLGASRINLAVIEALDEFLRFSSVVLISGAGQYDELRPLAPANDQNFQLHAFISKDMASLIGAADLVVTRAGATTILELAAASKPTILVPNAKLTGGHQIKNAKVYGDAGAVEIIDEDEMVEKPTILSKKAREILSSNEKTKKLSEEIAKFARPNAAKDVAAMILSCVK